MMFLGSIVANPGSVLSFSIYIGQFICLYQMPDNLENVWKYEWYQFSLSYPNLTCQWRHWCSNSHCGQVGQFLVPVSISTVFHKLSCLSWGSLLQLFTVLWGNPVFSRSYPFLWIFIRKGGGSWAAFNLHQDNMDCGCFWPFRSYPEFLLPTLCAITFLRINYFVVLAKMSPQTSTIETIIGVTAGIEIR